MMFFMEAENHSTGTTAIVKANSKDEMHEKLMELGFECLDKHFAYAGFNAEGHEVSVTSTLKPPHVANLNPVNQEQVLDSTETEPGRN